jgi:DeoR/GlpR family transcriptional regulator of sugar metabolism
VDVRLNLQKTEKETIAALALVEDGSTIMINGGTTHSPSRGTYTITGT